MLALTFLDELFNFLLRRIELATYPDESKNASTLPVVYSVSVYAEKVHDVFGGVEFFLQVLLHRLRTFHPLSEERGFPAAILNSLFIFCNKEVWTLTSR